MGIVGGSSKDRDAGEGRERGCFVAHGGSGTQIEEERGDGVEQSVTLVNWCMTCSTVPEQEREVIRRYGLRYSSVSCQTLNLFELRLYKM